MEMKTLDEILKALDKAQRMTKEKSRILTDLDTKVLYHRKAKKMQEARSTLLSLYYMFEDYAKTGRFELPTFK